MKYLWIFLLLVLSWCASLAESKADHAADLRGVWRLVSYRSSIKSPKQWTGLMFLDRGYFSRMYQEGDRPRLSFNFETARQLTPEQKDQLIASFKQFRAGIGTYRIEGNMILMKSTAIYNPYASGNEFSRTFRFEGKRMIFAGTTKVAGDTVEEVWERVE